jgi:hypothetical protein
VLAPVALVGSVSVLRSPNRAIAMFGAAALVLPISNPDWMVEHRFLTTFVPFAVALAATGLDTVLDMVDRLRGRLQFVRIATAGTAIMLSVYYAVVNVRASSELRSSHYATAVSMGQVHAVYEHMFDAPIKELGLHQPLVAIPDLGATSFELRMRILDIAGLADANIAHADRDPAQLDLYIFDEKRPDLIHAHGWWICYAQLPCLPGLSDYLVLSVRRGQTLADSGFEAVRKDLFIDNLPPGAKTTPLAGDIALVGIDGPDAVERNTVLPLDIYLTSTKTSPSSVELMIHLVRLDGTVTSTQQVSCGPSFYPCSQWTGSQRVRQRAELEAGSESGPRLVQLLARQDGGEWSVRFSRTLAVDSQLAREYAQKQVAIARQCADAANITGMERSLDLAEAAVPATGQWDSERYACAMAAARGIAGRAQVCFAVGEWEDGLQALRGADRLGGARSASSELRTLAARLLVSAAAERDPSLAYFMYRASWFANPQDAKSQRWLIKARRAFLLAGRRTR